MSTLHVENLKGLTSGGNANKVIIPTGQTLEVTDNIRYDDMPAGSVIQTVDSSSTSVVTTSSSGTWVDSGDTITITPKFATSKILVFSNQQIGKTRNSSGVARIDTKLIESNSGYILGSSAFEGTDNLASGNLSSYTAQHGTFQCSNTNQLTFKTQAKPSGGTNAAAIFPAWYTGSIHTITALEIAQ